MDRRARRAAVAASYDPKAAGSSVVCVACNRTKVPNGRSAAPEMAGVYCTYECPGYDCQPLPGSLWPGETREEFGYPCSTAQELAGKGRVYRSDQ